MRARLVLTGLLLVLTAAIFAAAAVSTAAAVSAADIPPGRSLAAALEPDAVEVVLDRGRIEAVVGERLTVQSRIVNSGDVPTDRLIAHLNVASLDGVYVDLEDWSADVTQQVGPVPPRASTSLSWQFQAVNTGRFDVYVVLMPNGDSSAGNGPLVASQPAYVTVAGRRTLTAAGSLPVAIAVPVVLGLAAAVVRLRVLRTGRR
jgi:hypothetical protein